MDKVIGITGKRTAKMIGTMLMLAVAFILWPAVAPAQIPGRFPNQQELNYLWKIAGPVVEAARARGYQCASTVFRIYNESRSPMTTLWASSRGDPRPEPCRFYIAVNMELLQQAPEDEQRAVFAHEMGHVMNQDYRPDRRPKVSPVERERQADLTGAGLLKSLGEKQCLAMASAQRHGDPDPGHPRPVDRAEYVKRACSE